MPSKRVSTQSAQRRESSSSFPFRLGLPLIDRNFLPDAGRLIHTRAPVSAPHRLETGFLEGDEVSSYYDPMVSDHTSLLQLWPVLSVDCEIDRSWKGPIGSSDHVETGSGRVSSRWAIDQH